MSKQDAHPRHNSLGEDDVDRTAIGATALDAETTRKTQEARRHAGGDGEAEVHEVVIHANYEFFVAGLLILQLVNSTLLLVPLLSEQREIVVLFWIAISAYLVVDSLARIRLATKRQRRVFGHYSWLTLAGSLPIPFATGVRLFGMAYVLRKLQRGEFKEIGNVVVSRRAQSTLLLVIFLSVIIFEFGSLMILVAEETAPAANITTSGDAIWWSLVTISTVGYGDTYPTTHTGRLIGFAMIVAGVGLFTSTTSFLARWFMRTHESSRQPSQDPGSQDGARAQIQLMRSLLEDLERNHRDTVAELEQRLDRLESSMATNPDK